MITKDAAGNWDGQPTVAQWSVDADPPFTTASQPSRFFNVVEPITLSSSEPATIHYTIDGTEPTDGSPVYAGPIQVGVGQVVKFFGSRSIGNRERVRVYGPMVQQVQLVLTGMTGATATFVACRNGRKRQLRGTCSTCAIRKAAGPSCASTVPTEPGSGTSPACPRAGTRCRSVCVPTGASVECDRAAAVDLLLRPQAAPVLINPGDQFNDDGARTYAEAVLADAPVAYWPLGEPSGAVAIDGTGFAAATRFGAIAGAQPGALSDGSSATLFNGAEQLRPRHRHVDPAAGRRSFARALAEALPRRQADAALEALPARIRADARGRRPPESLSGQWFRLPVTVVATGNDRRGRLAARRRDAIDGIQDDQVLRQWRAEGDGRLHHRPDSEHASHLDRPERVGSPVRSAATWTKWHSTPRR